MHRLGGGGGGAFPGGYAAMACSLLLTSSSAEIRNECELYRIYPVFLYGLHNNNITFAVIVMVRNKTKIKTCTSKVVSKAALRAMKAYRGHRDIAPPMLNLGTNEGEWLNLMVQSLYQPALHGRLGGPQSQYARFGEEKNILPLPGIEPQIVQPSCHMRCV